MPDYNGLADRLEAAGSPQSLNNGALPTTANQAAGILPINNTFSQGKYLDFVVNAESELNVATRGTDASGTRNVGYRG